MESASRRGEQGTEQQVRRAVQHDQSEVKIEPGSGGRTGARRVRIPPHSMWHDGCCCGTNVFVRGLVGAVKAENVYALNNGAA